MYIPGAERRLIQTNNRYNAYGYNICMCAFFIFLIVNLCHTKDVTATVYDVQDGIFKSMNPFVGEFVDIDYLGDTARNATDNLMQDPAIKGIANAYNSSGAADGLAKLFHPLIQKYENEDISGILADYGLVFDTDAGQYVVVSDVQLQEQ